MGKTDPIYLDHNATTPVDPQAVEAMMPHLKEKFGNPSSAYPIGTRAKQSVERAREQVAFLMGCASHEVTFSSGGSESNNAVIKGVIDFKRLKDFHIIVSAVEHPAVLNPALFLRDLGVEVSVLPVDGFGRVDPDEVGKAIKPGTCLISIMLANNETGTLQPVEEISKIAKGHGVPLHTDAAQAVGKIPVNVDDLQVDFLTVAGHKLYAPKGVGALYMRAGQNITPLIHGAGQEEGKRAGTENVVLCVGLGVAAQNARERIDTDARFLKKMRDRLQALLFDALEGLVLNGHPEERLPNTLNLSVPGVAGGEILDGLPRLMASTGAACHDRSVELSYVLSAMGVPPEVGMGALRLTVGKSNTMDQIEEAAKMIIDRVRELRR